MTGQSRTIGTCPGCGEPLPEGAVLVEYEADGETRRYVDCPGCGEPVRPATGSG